MVPEPRSIYALKFFLLAAGLLAIAIGCSQLLLIIFPTDPQSRRNQFSVAFSASTVFLFLGSWCMHQTVSHVRRERQSLFRRWLKLALLSGTVFVAVQVYALTCLIRQQTPDDASSSAAAFVAVFATLHGMHFVVAMLFLCYITIQAMADRYDHEYFWGVVVCAWFWHALGVAWIAILVVMMIAQISIERII